MKQLKFLSTLGIALVLLLSSCGGDEEKTTDTAVTDSTATTSTTTTESTINTTPETIIIVWHKVADYAKWKMAYDGHDSARLAQGIHNYVIGRGVDDSNMIMVATKADDAEKAKAFTKDPGLKTAMQKGGVMGVPKIHITRVVYQDMAPNMADLRSMTFFTVKDFDAWKAAFDSNKDMRTEKGLTTRAYGHEVDDSHKVVLSVAINDSAKANAYWNSDLIKQKRAESGVVGEVKRSIYRVVQKY